MPNIPPPPAGFVIDTPETPPPPDGYVLDSSSRTLPPSVGSVFSRPETFGERVRSLGRAVAPVVAGALPPIQGAEAGAAMGAPLGPVGSGIGAVAGAALGGFAAPSVQRQVESATTGLPYVGTPWRESAKSALSNALFTGLGEVSGPLIKRAQVGDDVKAELAQLPKAQQTIGAIKQIRQAITQRGTKAAGERAAVSLQDLRNRDFWKKLGLGDAEIDQVIKDPDLQADLGRSIAQANKTKDAFQSVVNIGRHNFNQDYSEILGKRASAPINVVPIGQQFEALAQGTGQHELTPTFRAFLQRKGLELTKAGEATGPSVGGVPWKHFPPKLREAIQAGAPAAGVEVPTETLTVQGLRDLRTELRENLPSNATPLDQQAYKQLRNQIGQAEESTLRGAGADQETIDRLRATDAEYGRFQDVIRTLDPRSKRFGYEVGNELFGPMAKNPGVAMAFVRYAQEANNINPNVMPDLREAFLNNALADARTAGQPMEELKALRKLQDRWGGAPQTRAVMSGLFGKDSPLANPATFERTIAAAAKPEELGLKLGQGGMGSHILRSPYIQGMILYGTAMALTGGAHSGLFMALTGDKGTAAQVTAVTSLLLGPKLVTYVARSGNGPLQRALVEFATKPSYATATQYASRLTGAIGTAGIMGSAQQ